MLSPCMNIIYNLWNKGKIIEMMLFNMIYKALIQFA